MSLHPRGFRCIIPPRRAVYRSILLFLESTMAVRWRQWLDTAFSFDAFSHSLGSSEESTLSRESNLRDSYSNVQKKMAVLPSCTQCAKLCASRPKGKRANIIKTLTNNSSSANMANTLHFPRRNFFFINDANFGCLCVQWCNGLYEVLTFVFVTRLDLNTKTLHVLSEISTTEPHPGWLIASLWIFFLFIYIRDFN